MIGKTARDRAARLGLDLGTFKTERELRIAIRRAEKEQGMRRPQHDCPFNDGTTWCPVHGALLR